MSHPSFAAPSQDQQTCAAFFQRGIYYRERLRAYVCYFLQYCKQSDSSALGESRREDVHAVQIAMAHQAPGGAVGHSQPSRGE